jgi:predicted Zn-dependent peptidase/predicted Ser/Thr protein kinase
MTECDARSRTLALGSGTLRSEEVAQARAHVETCAACRALLGDVGSAPTERVETPGRVVTQATMTQPERASTPRVERESRPWIGRYKVVGKLGSGGMGAVYAAEDPELDRRVAIKLLHGASETASARLVREARALAKLRHPNVVTIYEVGRDAGDAFVAMELVEGVTLREWLLGEHSIEARLEVMFQAGRGLMAAHAEGLIHRDFKPENVMVGRDGRVQVLDFGLAKTSASEEIGAPRRPSDQALESITQTGTLLGTPAYMAPEQFAAEATDARTDQFAYCVTLFEALHGFRPFHGKTHAELFEAVTARRFVELPLSDQVPPHVQALVMRGLSIDAAARYPDMKSLLAELHVRPKRKHTGMVVAALAIVAAGAGTGVWWVNREPASVPATIAPAAVIPDPLPEPLAEDRLKVTVHRLSNGLEVWISPNRKSPRIESRLVIRAGSRDNGGIGGLSHMVEHMALAGSTQIGTLDFAAEKVHLDNLRELYAAHARATSDADKAALITKIDAETVAASRFALPSELRDTASALGIRNYGAFTDHDGTQFMADVPSNKLSQWAKLEGERVTNPVFRGFHVEAGVVFDEVHSARARGSQQNVVDELVAATFAGHPYQVWPSGTYADLVAEPFTAAEAFHAKWYVPNNAALLLAGDVDPEQAIAVLERELGKWQPRPLPAREPRPLAPLTGEVRRVAKGMELPLVMVGWHTDPQGHADEDAVAALGQLLDHLGLKHAATVRIQTFHWQLVEAGVLGVMTFPVAGQPQDEALAVLDDVVRRIQAGEFSQETLAAVLFNYTLSLERAPDTNSDRLTRMASTFLGGRGWAHEVDRRKRVAALTKADLVRVAAKYLGKQRVVIMSEVGPHQMPPVKRPVVTPLQPKENLRSAFVTKLLAEETVRIPPRFVDEGGDYRITETAVGPLISVTNTEDNTFSLQLRWEIGDRQLPLSCAALHALLHAGTGDPDTASARQARWFARAQTATIECAPDTIVVNVTGVDATFEQAWADVERWLAGAGLSAEVWVSGAREYLAYRGWQRSGETVTAALATYAAFGKASQYLAGIESQQLQRATAADAQRALQQLTNLRRTITYYGPRSHDAIRLPVTPAAIKEPPPRPRLRPVRQPGTRIVAVNSGPNRPIAATIRFSLGPLDISRTAVARVFSSYVSNTGGGVLFNTLRNLHGLTFSGGVSWIDDGNGMGDDVSFQLRLETTAEQLPKALELAMAVVREPKIQPDQAALARNSTEDSYRANWISPRDLPFTVASWRAAGYKPDPRSTLYEQTRRTTERELSAFVRELAKAQVSISLTGDVSAIDRARLQAIGTVEVVAPAALFVP